MRTLGVIWDSEVNFEGSKPFNYGVLNTTYKVLGEEARHHNFKVAVSSFEEIEGSTLSKAYIIKDSSWILRKNVEIDAAFDKFKFSEETQDFKKNLRNSVPTLNPMSVEETAYDKKKTTEKFPNFTPKTLPLTENNLRQVISKCGKAVVKPVFAHGGKGVKVVGSVEQVDIQEYEDAIVQEFVNTTQGINDLDVEGVHDLRIVGVEDKPVFAYVRTNDEGFISNVSQGGSIEMVSLDEVPEEALEIFQSVASEFGHESFIFGVDLAFDEGTDPVILEINSTPGMPWYEDPEVKEYKLEFWKNILQEFELIL